MESFRSLLAGVLGSLLLFFTDGLPLRGQTVLPDFRVSLKGRVGVSTRNEEYNLKCDFLRLTLSGSFAENFHFIIRHRLNKAVTDGAFMSATDYFNVSWRRGGWELLGGKTYLACGGFEYLASSYDIYIRPGFFAGLGGMYNYALQCSRFFGNESLCIQAGNSIYNPGVSDLLGASMLLRGRQGPWEHAWSVNYFERAKGAGNVFLCLGNRFHIKEGTILDCSLAYRLDAEAPAFMKDFSAVVHLKSSVLPWLNIVGKATWDYKEAGIRDPMLPDGTDSWQAGGGVELFPVRSSEILRLHCIYYNRDGNLNCVMAGLSLGLDLR